MTDRKKCPSCGKTKLIDPGFGVRFKHLAPDDEGQVVQSWCVTCRRGAKGENVAAPLRNVKPKVQTKGRLVLTKPRQIGVTAKQQNIERETVTEEYRKQFPNDKGNGKPGGTWSRPIKFMQDKLTKKRIKEL